MEALAVDAVTSEVIQTRYKPRPLRFTSGVLREGEVRYTTPNQTLPTRYTFAGQYSYVSDDATDLGAAGFGLMFYNARWYDNTTGRFAQADTIVSGGVQGLDRYAYVNNSPVNYVDPSGHTIQGQCNWMKNYDCDIYGAAAAKLAAKAAMGDRRSCIRNPMCDDPGIASSNSGNSTSNTGAGATTSGTGMTNAKGLDFIGYSDWERDVLINLMNSGPTGYGMVMYILAHNVHLTFDDMIEGNGAQWQILNGQQLIVLNSNNFSTSTSTSDPFMLQLIAHEAKHLEQGPKVALSVYGEQGAWQVGIQVFIDLGHEPELSPWSKRLHNLPLNYNPANLWVADFYMQMRGGIGYPIWFLQLYPSPIGLAYRYYLASH